MDREQLHDLLRIYFPVASAILSSILSFLALLTLGFKSAFYLLAFSLFFTLFLTLGVFWYVQKKSYLSNTRDVIVSKGRFTYDILDSAARMTLCTRELTFRVRKPNNIYLMPKPTSTGKHVEYTAFRGDNPDNTCSVADIIFSGNPTLLIAFDSPLNTSDRLTLKYGIEDGFCSDHESVVVTSDVGQDACEICIILPPNMKPSECRWAVSYYDNLLEHGDIHPVFADGRYTIRYDFSKHIRGELIKKHCAVSWRTPITASNLKYDHGKAVLPRESSTPANDPLQPQLQVLLPLTEKSEEGDESARHTPRG